MSLFFFFLIYCPRVESSEQLTSHQRQKSRVFATKDTRRGEERRGASDSLDQNLSIHPMNLNLLNNNDKKSITTTANAAAAPPQVVR